MKKVLYGLFLLVILLSSVAFADGGKFPVTQEFSLRTPLVYLISEVLLCLFAVICLIAYLARIILYKKKNKDDKYEVDYNVIKTLSGFTLIICVLLFLIAPVSIWLCGITEIDYWVFWGIGIACALICLIVYLARIILYKKKNKDDKYEATYKIVKKISRIILLICVIPFIVIPVVLYVLIMTSSLFRAR